MPSVSSRQEKFMRAVAHDKAFSKKVDVSQSVGKEFNDADKAVVKKTKLSKLYKDEK